MPERDRGREPRGKRAYVFPGQGAQCVGMGRDLFDAFGSARAIFQEADEALGFPLSGLCFQGPEEALRQTINAQPAILTVSVACLKVASELGAKGLNNHPDFVAGHSLGEYTALVAAEALDFADAVRLVRERGRLMQEAGELQPGGMAAVMGLPEECVRELCRETGTQIANLNSSGQIVISGRIEELHRAMELAEARGARHVVKLNVGAAFHSPLMQPAGEEMARLISQLSFREPRVPIVANVTALPLTSAEEIKRELVQQLSQSVAWQRSVEYMIAQGVSTFVEIGPGKVLSGLIKRIDERVEVLNVNSASSFLED